MNAQHTGVDLASVGPGFDDPVHDSQMCFRQALDALACPGRIVECGVQLRPPAGLGSATTALLLTLLDGDCSLWVSPGAQTLEISNFLRFHTGCALVASQADARFVLVHNELELPRLSNLDWGSDEYPDQSATLIVQLESLGGVGPWLLNGPGIERSRSLRAGNLPLWFVTDWALVHSSFPRGLEVFLCAGKQLAALARTTRLTLQSDLCTLQ